MAAELERGHHAEVTAAAAQRPEQVRVLVGASGDERAVGEHDVRGQQAVDREPEPPGQVAGPAAERETGDPGGAEDARGDGQAEGARGVVDVAPDAAALGDYGLGPGVDPNPAHRRKVDDQGVVPHPQAAGVVPAAAHRDSQVMVAREPDCRDDVGHVGAAGYRRGRRSIMAL